MMFDSAIYFDRVRQEPFGGALTQAQVIGQNSLLYAWEQGKLSPDLRHLAYALATTFHETDRVMWPIEEYGKGKGHEYGVPDPETGKTYYGRGYVQLTWKENYDRATRELGLAGTPGDLVWNPTRALDLMIASMVLYQGMEKGWFTGKKLSHYFNESANDPVGARYIINAQDKAETIAGYHDAFLEALEASLVEDEATPAPEPEPPPAPTPAPPSPIVVHIRVEGATQVVVD